MACFDVVIEEPPLQPLLGEAIVLLTANKLDKACTDIHAQKILGEAESFLMYGFSILMHPAI